MDLKETQMSSRDSGATSLQQELAILRKVRMRSEEGW